MVKVVLTLAACTCFDEAAIRARAAARTSEILSAPDMDVPVGATQFFVSPDGTDEADGRSEATAWRTLARLAREKVPSGSFVRFKRGGTWRGMVRARPGVTYAAYGKEPSLVSSAHWRTVPTQRNGSLPACRPSGSIRLARRMSGLLSLTEGRRTR